MSNVHHSYWDEINHPYRMLEKHYNEIAWNLVKNNEVSVWGSFEPVKFEENIDWGMDPFDNETWCFYFNGLSWLYSYLWAISNLGESPEKMFSIVEQYNSHINSENPNKMVWFDHSTSDRLSILSVISLHPIYDEASEERKSIFKQLIELHIERIKDFKNSRKWVNSNHGVFHSLALLNASNIYSNPEEKTKIKKIGLEYLSETLQTILCLEECVSLEQSAYYHQLAISLIESLQEEHLENIGLNKNEFISKLIDNNFWITINERKLIAIGDTSVISNIRDDHSPNNIPTNHFKTFRNLGASFVKYNTANGYNHFSFLHSELRAPHGHFDSLSITLSKGNKELIIDSGGPYRYGNQLRFKYFMSSFAHNVAIINGKKHESGATLIRSELLSEDVILLEAEHTGYFPIKHSRKCIYVKNKGLIISDSFSNISAPTDIQLLWHIHPNCQIDDDLVKINNDNEFLWKRSLHTIEKKIVSGIEGDNPQGWVTPGIGLKNPCPTLIDSVMLENDTTIITYFEYEKNCLEGVLDTIDISKPIPENDPSVKIPFGFNISTICKYISNDLVFWQPGTYFGDRNIWKINKSQQKLTALKLSVEKRAEIIKKSIENRIDSKIPTIYIISNGGSGCHYLGGLISMKEGFQLIDEVYFPPIIIDNLESFDKKTSHALIEMVNFVHLGDLDKSDTIIPVNTMHLRKDVPLTKIKQSSNPIFINLIRNPIDVAISRGLTKTKYKDMNKENSEIPEDVYLERQAIGTMNHFTRLNNKINIVDAITVRFEDLIKDPRLTIKTVFTHIGCNLTNSEIDEIISNYQDEKNLTENKNSSEKPNLTTKQKEILLTHLSKTCEDLGYDIPEYAKL